MEVQSTKADWWEKAACKGAEISVFVYADRPRGDTNPIIERALAYCDGCPVLGECAQAEAQTRGENRAAWPYQIRAGLKLWTDEADLLPSVIDYYKYVAPKRLPGRPSSNPYERRHQSDKFKSIELDGKRH